MNETIYFYVLLVVVFLLAGVVKGVTGMGLPTVAMGLLGGALSPVAAASMLFIPTFVTNAWQLLSGPSVGQIVRRLWPMMLAVVIATLGAAALLVRVDRDVSRAALGLAFTVSTISLTTGLVLHGAFGVQQLGLSALAVVPSLAGMWLGQVIRQRISARVFRACFLGFLLLLGLELVLRSWW